MLLVPSLAFTTLFAANVRRRPRDPRPGRTARAGLVAALVLAGCGGIGREELDDAIDNVDTSEVAEVIGDALDQLQSTTSAQNATQPTGPSTDSSAEQPTTATSAPTSTDTPTTEPPAPTTTSAPVATADAAPTTVTLATDSTIDSAPDSTAQPNAAQQRSTLDWILIGLLLLATIALTAAIVMAATGRAEARATARRALQNRLSDVVGRSRWVHDSGSRDVLLSIDVDRMQLAWTEVRGQIVGLESDLAALSAQLDDPGLVSDLQYLARSLGDLRSAQEAYVTTRARAGNSRTELTRISDETVSARRRQLQGAIEPLAAALRR